MLIFFKIMFVKKRKQKYLVFIQEYKMNIISMNIVFIYCKNIKHKFCNSIAKYAIIKSCVLIKIKLLNKIGNKIKRNLLKDTFKVLICNYYTRRRTKRKGSFG